MRFIGDDVANGNIGAAQQRRPTMIQIGRAELPLRQRWGTTTLPTNKTRSREKPLTMDPAGGNIPTWKQPW